MSTTDIAVGREGGWTPRLVASTLVMMLIVEAATLAYILISTALPQITAHFQTTQGGWLITAYALAGAVSCPLAGKLADIHGKRKLLIACLLVSFVGALVSLFAPVFWLLIVGRLLQGVVVPTGFLAYSLMRDVYPPRILPMATSVSMTGIGLFTIGTPFLVGWILDTFGFRGVFAFDALWLIVMIPLLALTTRETAVRKRSRVDFIGAGTLALGLGSVLLGVSKGSTWGWGSAATLGFIIGGVVLLGVFILRSLRFPEPIVNLRIFLRRGIVFVVVAAGATYTAAIANSAMSSIIAQTPRELGGDYGLGLSAFGFGFLAAPTAICIVVFGVIAGKLIPRFGAGAIMLIGLAFCLAASVFFAFAHDTFTQILWAGVLLGTGSGLAYAAIPTLVIANAPKEDQGSIAGMVQNSYSLFSAITPVVLFVILGKYVVKASPEGVIYQSAGFRSGALFAAFVVAVVLVLGLTVLRLRRDQGVIPQEDAATPSLMPAGTDAR